MIKKACKYFLLALGVLTSFGVAGQQKVLTMQDAEKMALDNYASIKAKMNQLNASKAYLTETKTEYLPDISFSGQQDYGTV
ncbi:MAG: TolC family protein, partial [Bacteroidetes bacterium]|nr:TolC family protein [Bacteroidota bacterium]